MSLQTKGIGYLSEWEFDKLIDRLERNDLDEETRQKLVIALRELDFRRWQVIYAHNAVPHACGGIDVCDWPKEVP